MSGEMAKNSKNSPLHKRKEQVKTVRITFSELWKLTKGFPDGSHGKDPAYNPGDTGQSLGQKIPWRREWQPISVFFFFFFHFSILV